MGGKYFASIDEEGVCLLSDIDTNNPIHHLKLLKKKSNYFPNRQMLKLIIKDGFAQCRFSAFEGDPTLFVNTLSSINMLDFEKAQLNVKASIGEISLSHRRAHRGYSFFFLIF